MFGVNVGAILLTAINTSLFLPYLSVVVIGVNLALAGFNGYHGFLSEKAEEV